MKQFNYAKGKGGEQEARNYLLEHGFSLLEMNYRNKIGEIDLIMSEDDTLVFVEVKQKSDDFFGKPEEMVTTSKLRQVRRVAEIYLLTNPKLFRKFPKQRIDAVCILGGMISHYRNVGL